MERSFEGEEESDVKGTCEKMTVKISRNWLAIKRGVIRVARVKIHRSILRPCECHSASIESVYIVSNTLCAKDDTTMVSLDTVSNANPIPFQYKRSRYS